MDESDEKDRGQKMYAGTWLAHTFSDPCLSHHFRSPPSTLSKGGSPFIGPGSFPDHSSCFV